MPPIEAWYMDEDVVTDQRAPHRLAPNKAATPAELDALGVLQFKLKGDGWEADPELEAIKKARGYTYTDIITVSPEKLPNYETKIKSFYEEHLHTDEEIRYCLDGSGYFDVRDKKDQWIRISVQKGDMIILPAGIYHRFTLDEKNYIHAMRLFVGEPIWTPYNRVAEGVDAMPARSSYVKDFVAKEEGEAGATGGAAAGAGSA